MICFRVRQNLGSQPVASGVELGRAHFAKVVALLDSAPNPPTGTLVGWDFGGVAVASISYIKATLLHCVALGRWHAQALTHVETDWMNVGGHRPRDVFAFALNADDEVAEAIDHAFARQCWPVLAGTSVTQGPPNKADHEIPPLEWLPTATLLGQVDTASAKTLEAIDGSSRCTALELHERFARSQNIGPTGWNNRLADLYRARLARRSRQGKFWIYHPLAKNVNVSYGQGVFRS